MFNNTKLIRMLGCLIAASFMLSAVCYASGMEGASRVSVRIDGEEFVSGEELFFGGVTYVPLRAFVQSAAENASVEWDGENSEAKVRANDLYFSACAGKNYIEANGRCIASDGENVIRDGVMYVPLRSAASAFGMEVSWSGVRRTAYVISTGKTPESEEKYDVSDLFWLSHIINAEACTESFAGKVAVGNVVLNRVASDHFPDTVREVIFQESGGIYQFTPVKNGTVYNDPDGESILAAKACLEGYSISDDVLFFIRESIAVSKWVSENRRFVVSIGNHDFYA